MKKGSPSAADQLRAAVREAGLQPGTRILVAVSGGPDSVALACTLESMMDDPTCQWKLLVGHINHGLRGEESDDDERFVVELARGLGLECQVARVDTAARARGSRASVETAGRIARYETLTRWLQEWPGDVVATGHTRNDQAETVLLNLIRGAGVRGLAGMHVRSGCLVRPFLSVAREDILACLEELGQAYREDSSNRDTTFRRNFVRARIMPELATIQPRIVDVLARTAHVLATDADYLEAEAENACEALVATHIVGGVSFDIAAWRSLHPGLARHTLRCLLAKVRSSLADIDEAHLASIATGLLTEAGVTPEQLPHALHVTVRDGRATVRTSVPQVLPPLPSVSMTIPGTVTLPAGQLAASLLTPADSAEMERLLTVCGPFHALCDASMLGSSVQIRSRRPGDRLRPQGAPGSRKLQDLMVDRHVVRDIRDQIPIVTTGEEIVWVPGLALDERFAASAETDAVVHLRFEPTTSDTVVESSEYLARSDT